MVNSFGIMRAMKTNVSNSVSRLDFLDALDFFEANHMACRLVTTCGVYVGIPVLDREHNCVLMVKDESYVSDVALRAIKSVVLVVR